MTQSKNQLTAFALFTTALILVAIAVTMLSPILDDFAHSWYPMANLWLKGQTHLYDNDIAYYNPPWFLALLLPIAPWPIEMGQVVFTAFTVLSIIVSVICLKVQTPIPLIAMIFLNRNTLNLLGVGETDAIILLGACIGYLAAIRKKEALLSVAFCLMAIKPQNVFLVSMLFLYSTRSWKSLLIPIFVVVASELFEPYWVVRWLGFVRTLPPPTFVQTNIWATNVPTVLLIIGTVLSLVYLIREVRRGNLGFRTFALAMAVNLAFTPYALSAHYVLLTPGFIYLALRSRWMAIFYFILTFLPQMIQSNLGYSLYPFAILLGVILVKENTFNASIHIPGKVLVDKGV